MLLPNIDEHNAVRDAVILHPMFSAADLARQLWMAVLQHPNTLSTKERWGKIGTATFGIHLANRCVSWYNGSLIYGNEGIA